jgi:hypothetical protein
MLVSFEYVTDENEKIVEILIEFDEEMTNTQKVLMLSDLLHPNQVVMPLIASSVKKYHPELFELWKLKFRLDTPAVTARGVFGRE